MAEAKASLSQSAQHHQPSLNIWEDGYWALKVLARQKACMAVKEQLRALRPLQGASPYVFVTEGGTPVTMAWFLRMIQRTGRAAKLAFPVHPHVLRHSTGYKLANDGHDT